jgi:hypothetical protein
VDDKLRGKMERYFKNASRFFWGLGNGNQKETYIWLKSYGKQRLGLDFDFKEGSYRDVIAQLIQNPGIERLIKDLVAPRIKEMYNDQVLEFLRVSWNSGTLPDISYLEHFSINIKEANPFLEINK